MVFTVKSVTADAEVTLLVLTVHSKQAKNF
jgi:hypothetical protein